MTSTVAPIDVHRFPGGATIVRMRFRVRDRTKAEDSTASRYPAPHRGEVCDFCARRRPYWSWMLEGCAVDVADITVIPPPVLYSCSRCRKCAQAGDLECLHNLHATRLTMGPGLVRQAVWAAVVARLAGEPKRVTESA